MKKSTISDIVLAVTYRCNSRCRMCGIWQITEHKPEFLPSVLANLPKTLKSLNLTGGEPFLRADLPEFITQAKKTCPGVKIIISSNGFATELILKQMTQILAIDSTVGVALSLDGVGARHEAVRGIEHGFDKVMATLTGLKQLGVKSLKLAFTIADYNYDQLQPVYALAKKHQVEFTVAAVHSGEAYFKKDNTLDLKTKIADQLIWLSKQELATWQPKRWVRAFFAYGLAYYVNTGQRVLPDYSGQKNIFIDPQGNVYPNDVTNMVIGTISDMTKIKSETNTLAPNWMICTAREAIRSHPLPVIAWIITHKFLGKKTSYENSLS
ncbi:MAG: radical SAM protein [Candidatus Falkowbacteria bacterium]